MTSSNFIKVRQIFAEQFDANHATFYVIKLQLLIGLSLRKASNLVSILPPLRYAQGLQIFTKSILEHF